MARGTEGPDQTQDRHARFLVPRWVKVFALVALALALLLLAHMLLGGGSHGPSLHDASAIAHLDAATAGLRTAGAS